MKNKDTGANLGFEQKMWQAADKLKSNMDAAECKHVVLGLIFLKYISDAFKEMYEELSKDSRLQKDLSQSLDCLPREITKRGNIVRLLNIVSLQNQKSQNLALNQNRLRNQ